MIELNAANLTRLDKRIRIPCYDRSRLVRGIVHLGVGGFHRAHQALYTDEVLSHGDQAWGIVGAGILKQDRRMRDVLMSQDCLYTVVAKGSAGIDVSVVGSIVEYRYGGDSTACVIDALCAVDTRIISLTVTEEGYCYEPDSRQLDMKHPGIVHDLGLPNRPVTIIGCLAEALDRVRRAGRTPPTVMSCDNVPHNGSVLRRLVLDFAAERDPDLAGFIEEQVLFPNTMVDRITPMTTDVQREELKREYGLADAWPVFCEDFRQWIIEDSFTRGRPDWSSVGVQFTSDVAPYERMKIRMLNGAHMALSHLAYLAGYRDVDRAMADPDILTFVDGFIREASPTVGSVPGMDLDDYRRSLLGRFANSAIHDQVFRLTMDSSRKIPNMLLPTLVDLLESGAPADHIAFANAAWIRFSTGTDETGASIPVDDQQAGRLREAALSCARDARPFLSLAGIFPGSIVADRGYLKKVSGYLEEIRRSGAKQALAQFISQRRKTA